MWENHLVSTQTAAAERPLPFCVDFCERVRAIEHRPDPAELGSGLLELPPFGDLEDLVQNGMKYLFRSGVATRFGLSANDELTDELARTLETVLHTDSISADDVLLTDGATHGLSCVFEYCARNGIGVLLPLPCYFGYELAAVHAGVVICGYYDPARISIVWLNTTSSVCLVVNTPDALTGEVLRVDQIRELRAAVGSRLALTVVDLICAMHGYSVPPEKQSRPRDVWQLRNDGGLVVLFGVTKDLAIPGFRAGMLLGTEHAVVRHCRDSIFARSFAASVVNGVIMLIYVLLLAVMDGEDSPDEQPNGPLSRRRLTSRVLTSLSEDTAARFVAQRRDLDAVFATTLTDLSTQFGGVLVLPQGRDQHVGYSVMAGLRRGVRGIESVIEATKSLLRSSNLRVNPSYMFGGTPALWELLYPHQLHLRLNLSTRAEVLQTQLHSALSRFMQ